MGAPCTQPGCDGNHGAQEPAAPVRADEDAVDRPYDRSLADGYDWNYRTPREYLLRAQYIEKTAYAAGRASAFDEARRAVRGETARDMYDGDEATGEYNSAVHDCDAAIARAAKEQGK